MTNIYEINELVNFLSKYSISFKQFAYCILLHYDKKYSRIEGSHKISRPLSQMYRYHQNIEKFTKKEIEDLIDKGLLHQKGKKYKPDMLEVTDKFVKNWYGDKYKIDQLIETYPKKVENWNHPSKPKIPLCTFDDYDSLKKRYNQFVTTYKLHDRIIELVQWAKENNELKLGIQKFVNSKYWEQLEQMKEGEGSFDNHTMI